MQLKTTGAPPLSTAPAHAAPGPPLRIVLGSAPREPPGFAPPVRPCGILESARGGGGLVV